ncbi:MAG: ABC transporter ATP-binding protein [Candidatus Kariarchaeaceae archaeon]|jgi:ATP-binding cassette subfamily B protein
MSENTAETKEKKQAKEKRSDIFLLKRLWNYLFYDKKYLLVVFILFIIQLVVSVLLPYILSMIIDDTIIKLDRSGFTVLVFIYLGLAVLRYLVQYLQRWFLAYIGEHATFKLRRDTFKKIQQHSIDYFDETPTGEILSRFTNDLNSMQPILSGQVLFVFISLLTTIGMFVVMFSISISLSVAALSVIPFALIPIVASKRYSRPAMTDIRKYLGEMSSSMTENIMGARVSTAFARGYYNQDEFVRINRKFSRHLFRWYKIEAVITPFYGIAWPLVFMVILVTGSTLIVSNNDSDLSLGILYLFLLYVGYMIEPIWEITGIYGQLQNGFAGFERVINLIDQEPSVKEKLGAKDVKCESGTITINNITFSYNSKDLKVFEDFNLRIKANEVVAMVGQTGSGKTTLTSLITRLYDVNSGSIQIDEQDIREVTLSSLRKNIGVVLQDPVLYSESIRYNLCYGADVSDDRLKHILKLIGADFVFDLPNGLDTLVGERGNRLSMGQKQLISFARALVPNPKILLLDEATSSIDPQAELRIQQAMAKMLENRTSIIIAHRLSTVREANRIIVLEKGKIIEEGNFEELINKKKHFYELYKLQFN